MQIQYYGLSSFRIQTKQATVITDPFDKKSGLAAPRGAADILMLAEKNNALYSAVSGISGEPFSIIDPGEYDLKGVAVAGIPLKQDEGYVVVYLIESEDIKILNLTHIRQWSMKESELEELGDIDILIVPVGGASVLDANSASKIVNQISPKIVIPSHYKISGLDIELEPVDRFIKEMGGKSETMEKLTIKKKELPVEDTKIIILEALR